MAIESYITVTPAYYEIALERKYTRDEESSEMVDIILANRVYDIGMVYSTIGIGRIFEEQAVKKNADFASVYAKKEKSSKKKLELIVEAFAEMG